MPVVAKSTARIDAATAAAAAAAVAEEGAGVVSGSVMRRGTRPRKSTDAIE